MLQFLTALAPVLGAGIDAATSRANAAETNRINARRIRITVNDAQKAGISPLTALSAGAANFTPAQAGPTGFGSAAAQAAANLTDNRLSDLQERLLREQVRGLELENQARAVDLNTRVQRASSVRPYANPLAGNAAPDVYLFGRKLPRDPATTDAEVCQRRYGDIAEEVCGAIAATADFRRSVSRGFRAGLSSGLPGMYYRANRAAAGYVGDFLSSPSDRMSSGATDAIVADKVETTYRPRSFFNQ